MAIAANAWDAFVFGAQQVSRWQSRLSKGAFWSGRSSTAVCEAGRRVFSGSGHAEYKAWWHFVVHRGARQDEEFDPNVLGAVHTVLRASSDVTPLVVSWRPLSCVGPLGFDAREFGNIHVILCQTVAFFWHCTYT